MEEIRQSAVGVADRTGNSPRAGARGRFGAQPGHSLRPGAARAVSGQPGAVPRERQRASAGSDVAPARPRAHAAADQRLRAGGVLQGTDRRHDRRGNAARRRPDHQGRSPPLSRQMAHPDQTHVPRPHDLLDAARQLGWRHDGRDPQHPRGLRYAARVRHTGLRAHRHRSDAPGVHRPQPLAWRSRFCGHAARATALQVLCGDVTCPDRSHARDAHASATGSRRGHAHDALLDRGLDGQCGICDHDLERRLRQRGDGHGRRVPPQQRNGRLRDGAGQAEHVWARAGRGERRRRWKTDALGDGAVDRARQRRQSSDGRGHAGRPDDHHERHAGDSQRARPAHEPARRCRGAPDPSPGAPGPDLLRARRLERRDRARARGDGA